jgi:transmembrane sensor
MTEGSFNEGSSRSSRSSRSPDWELLARELAGESAPGDSARISPEEREMLGSIDDLTSALKSGIPQDLDVEAALAKVKARPEFTDRDIITLGTGVRNRWHVPMPALAAAALLAVGFAGWMAYDNRPRETAVTPLPRMLGTGVGVRDSMTLVDGTRIVLGPLSSVKVVSGYGSGSREVEVRGDAWFDVTHDASKPFTVHAGSATITDVGTTFAVRSDDPAGVSVSVSDGAVSLRRLTTPVSAGVILKAGDNGLLQSDGRVVARRGSATEDDVAWLKGRLVFRGAPISQVAAEMRKWYGIELKVADGALNNRHLTATFAGESAERVLETIRLALGADIERRGDTAVVRLNEGNTR